MASNASRPPVMAAIPLLNIAQLHQTMFSARREKQATSSRRRPSPSLLGSKGGKARHTTQPQRSSTSSKSSSRRRRKPKRSSRDMPATRGSGSRTHRPRLQSAASLEEVTTASEQSTPATNGTGGPRSQFFKHQPEHAWRADLQSAFEQRSAVWSSLYETAEEASAGVGTGTGHGASEPGSNGTQGTVPMACRCPPWTRFL